MVRRLRLRDRTPGSGTVPLHPGLVEQDSTRPSDAASSVSAQPAEPRAFLPISSRHRSTTSSLPASRASLTKGCTTSVSSGSDAWASALVQPITDLLQLGRENVRELGPGFRPRHDNDPRPAEAAEDTIEALGDRLVVLEVEIFDVALVARLRPAALIAFALRLLSPVGDLRELALAQREHSLTPPAADDRHDGAVPAPDQRHEWAEQEVVPRRGQRLRPSREARVSLQTLSGPAAKTASPCAPSRSNSSSK